MNNFQLKRPCAHCPFSIDAPEGWLGRRRAVDIAGGLFGRETGDFPCHKTYDYNALQEAIDESEDGYVGLAGYTEKTQQCAGALALMEKEGTQSQFAQVASRLGQYDPQQLDGSRVFESVEDFVNHHSEEL